MGVTIAHIINGDTSPVQGIIDIVAQGLGGILGSTLLLLTLHDTVFECHTGQNNVTTLFHNEHAFIAEALVTFFVVTAVLEIKSNANCSPAAVGLAYFLATLFLFPIVGAILAAVWRKLTGDSSAEAEPPTAADQVESE